MANTGRLIYTRLLKVSDDGNEIPLDADNMPASQTGNPQDVKLNTLNEEGYVPPVTDLDTCPIGI